MVTRKRRLSRPSIASLAVAVGFVLLWTLTPGDASFKQAITWQRLTEPGALSSAHASLENNCAACHTSVVGVEPAKCIVCHANDEAILRRQPTSFHASISSCTECHLEHQGRGHRPTYMDHTALAGIGLRQLNDGDVESENSAVRALLLDRLGRGAAPHPQISPLEAILDCSTCHANDDRHFSLFGEDCAQCHLTTKWTIPEFRHPSSRSRDCAHCHQAPPSHYMMHFKMISARVARKPHARVDQCHQCHQTTSWIDIKDVGLYKHH